MSTKYTGTETCPKCGTGADIRASYDTSRDQVELTCPKCNHRFTVRPLDSPDA